jgi:hypothetical protein
MFDELYPEAADAALSNAAQRVAPVPEVPWFKGAWSAIGKAVPRAGAEMGRAGTSLLTPESAGAMDAPSMFSAGKSTKSQLAEELREQDNAIRDAIKEMTPDPQTTGTASMVLHDVARFVGKAGAYSLLGGAPAAVAGMTLDEGANEALRRMDEGVDPTTAAKLGAVKGVASGIAVALPVAGKTIAQTLGLAAVGGPGGYIAEQATAREILESADYSKAAAQIDPFDPLGLGVSFFGSLLFGAGAHAARGVKAKADAKAADARMLSADQPPGELTQTAQAARAYTPEQVDAAHVSILQAQREGSALHAREDIAAGGKHAEALDRASEQLATGQRVSVAEIPEVDLERLTANLEDITGRVNRAAPDLRAWMDEAGIAPPEPVALEAPDVKGNPFIAMLKEAGGVAFSQKYDIVGERGIRGNYAGIFRKTGTNLDLLVEHARAAGYLTQADIDNPSDIGGTRALSEMIRRATMGEKIMPAEAVDASGAAEADARAALAAVEQMKRELRSLGVDPEAARGDADILGNYLSEHREALVNRRLQEISDETAIERQVIAEAAGLHPDTVDSQARIAFAQELDEAAVERAAIQATDGVDFLQRIEEILANAPRRSETDAGRQGSARNPEVSGSDVAPSATADGTSPAFDFYAAEADRVTQQTPDLPVMLEGMDAPMPASKLLAEIKALADQEIADAPLLRVAAECALRG